MPWMRSIKRILGGRMRCLCPLISRDQDGLAKHVSTGSKNEHLLEIKTPLNGFTIDQPEKKDTESGAEAILILIVALLATCVAT